LLHNKALLKSEFKKNYEKIIASVI
jgi:hypothetical protein